MIGIWLLGLVLGSMGTGLLKDAYNKPKNHEGVSLQCEENSVENAGTKIDLKQCWKIDTKRVEDSASCLDKNGENCLSKSGSADPSH